MTTARLASLRPRAGGATVMLVLAVAALGACSTVDAPSPTVASPTAGQSTAPTASPFPTPSPTPTPPPTPRYTNEADAELMALVPTSAAGVTIVVPSVDEFGLTPGDVGSAYGEIGDRFSALAIGYVEQPRMTLYAVRVDGEAATTADLEPHLATAGRYVGIAGLDPDPWQLVTVDAGHRAWVRPEDNATVAGTMIYTWAADGYLFLLIGVDDAINRAVVAALPGEPPPSPTPAPSRTPAGTSGASPSAAPSGG
jgi:hypothetical protein